MEGYENGEEERKEKGGDKRRGGPLTQIPGSAPDERESKRGKDMGREGKRRERRKGNCCGGQKIRNIDTLCNTCVPKFCTRWSRSGQYRPTLVCFFPRQGPSAVSDLLFCCFGPRVVNFPEI